jgi:class 3 adenylate cyclase
MFCDLVGSTSLAAKSDAEDWRNLVNAYLDEASKAVTGFGGHVLKKLGDGLMALSHPQENRRRTRGATALAVQHAIANARNAQTSAPELVARIGPGKRSRHRRSTGEVFGEAPNAAARVQAAAEPGTVMVTSTVQRQVAGLFIAEDKARMSSGCDRPMTLYRILRISGGGAGPAPATTPSLAARRPRRSSPGAGSASAGEDSSC